MGRDAATRDTIARRAPPRLKPSSDPSLVRYFPITSNLPHHHPITTSRYYSCHSRSTLLPPLPPSNVLAGESINIASFLPFPLLLFSLLHRRYPLPRYPLFSFPAHTAVVFHHPLLLCCVHGSSALLSSLTTRYTRPEDTRLSGAFTLRIRMSSIIMAETPEMELWYVFAPLS